MPDTILQEIDSLKTKLDNHRPLSLELLEKINEKLRIEWTYNSNAIEGNTLTLHETSYFLQYGLTSKGKTLKDYLEAQNHAEAIEWIKDIIKSDRPISEGLIKEIHALLMKGIDYIWVGAPNNKVKKSTVPGKYKSQPNHVLRMDGEIHKYCEPIKVTEEMARLISFIDNSSLHPVELAAIAHYKLVAIHPFDDGNGRVARLLMNFLLMRKQYLPVIIQNENREDYYLALMEADKGDMSNFINIVAQEEKNSLQTVLKIICT